jgi:hypothetical protein
LLVSPLTVRLIKIHRVRSVKTNGGEAHDFVPAAGSEGNTGHGGIVAHLLILSQSW